MIWLCNSGNIVGFYRTFEGVCEYFVRLERFRAMDQGLSCSEYPGAFSEYRWDFSCISFRRLRMCVEGLKADARLSMAEQEAYVNGLDLLELCEGDSRTFEQIALFPGVDVEGLARDWSFGYARAKNFTLFELVDGEGSGAAYAPGHRLFSCMAQTDRETEGKA